MRELLILFARHPRSRFVYHDHLDPPEIGFDVYETVGHYPNAGERQLMCGTVYDDGTINVVWRREDDDDIQDQA